MLDAIESGDTYALFQVLDYLDGAQYEEALDFFWYQNQAHTWEEFKAAHPPGSRGWRLFHRALRPYDIAAVLIKNEVLSPDLFFELHPPQREWARAEAIVRGMRQENPLQYCNLEWMVRRYQEWREQRTDDPAEALTKKAAGS